MSSSSSTTVSSTTDYSSASIHVTTGMHAACTAAQYIPVVRRSGRLVARQRSLQTHELERNAQQQAWQAEMILQHQPWEGAVSPVAMYANAAFESGDWDAGMDSERFDGYTFRSSSDGAAKVVDILRISSSDSYRSFGMCECGDGRSVGGASSAGCTDLA
jgi:hypothetical protein